MKIRKACALEKLYGHTHPIKTDSPELLFMRAVCDGDTEKALSFFAENKQFLPEKSAVDAPYGRYEGLAGIREFVNTFLARFEAQACTLKPIIQTLGGGRAVLEVQLDFEVDGQINQVPMFVVADFRGTGLLDEIRLYCHFTYVPGLQAYRKPIFRSAYMELADPALLTGAVREYYSALHHYPAVDVERIMGCVSEDCIFGGYARADEPASVADTHEGVRAAYEHMATYIPRCVGMRYETIIDDGRTCVIEWVHLISKDGQREMGRIAMSGIAAYERNADGYLCSIRISDYAYCEGTIDWSRVAVSKEQALETNLIDCFPSHVGSKSLG